MADAETILWGDTVYDRYRDDGGALDETEWQVAEGDEVESVIDDLVSLSAGGPTVQPLAAGMAVFIAQDVYLGGLEGPTMSATTYVSGGPGGDPPGYLTAIDRMSAPTMAGQADGVTTMAATFEMPAEVQDLVSYPFPEGHVELDVGADDRPIALRLDVEDGDSRSTTEIVFSAWDEPVEIATPQDPEEIEDQAVLGEDDGTSPDVVDEIRGLQQLVLLQPTAVPDDWELTAYGMADLVDMGLDTGGCESLALNWDQFTGDGDYLWLLQRPLDCAMAADPTPFEPDGFSGLPSRTSATLDGLEVQVGDTALMVDSSLDDAELGVLLASLEPATTEAIVGALG